MPSSLSGADLRLYVTPPMGGSPIPLGGEERCQWQITRSTALQQAVGDAAWSSLHATAGRASVLLQIDGRSSAGVAETYLHDSALAGGQVQLALHRGGSVWLSGIFQVTQFHLEARQEGVGSYLIEAVSSGAVTRNSL